MTQNWLDITIEALQTGWREVLVFLPKLLISIAVFIIGWFVSVAVGKIISEVLKKLKLDRFFEKAGWKEALEKAEIKMSVSEFIGGVFKWISVIIFLLVSVEILGLVEFADFLKKIVWWLPNLIVAVAIFIVAVVVADILEKIIKASVKKIEISYAGLLGTVVKWAIYIFAGFAILIQLGVAPTIVNALVFGLIATLSLSLGLAFGLGGKDAAAKLIEEIRKKVSEK